MSGFPLMLMRHGAPTLAGRLIGHTDCAVTAAGIAACVEQARDLEFAALVSSDLARARRCAEAIGTPAIDPRWREIDFGAWDGMAPAAIDSDAQRRFQDDPDGYPPPGGERWSDLVARVGAAIEALAPVPTLVVTHAGAMRAALAWLGGLPQGATWLFDLPYACMLSLTVWEGVPRQGQVTALWP